MIDYKLLDPYLNNEQFCNKLDDGDLQGCFSDIYSMDIIQSFTDLLLNENIDIIAKLKDTVPAYCFAQRKDRVEYSLPDKIIKINGYAFFQNINLKNIQLPSKVEVIGERAFSDCYELREIILPDTVIYLGDGVFEDCLKLNKVYLNNKIEILPIRLFYNCRQLEAIMIPNSVNLINNECFKDCTRLSMISYDGTMDDLLNTVEIGKDTFRGISTKVIHCIDGDVEIYKLWRK